MGNTVSILVVGPGREFFKIAPLLRRANFEVNQAASAEAALLLTTSVAYNLIVVVHPLRELGTTELLQRVWQQDSASADAPVLILAAAESVGELAELAESGRVTVVSSSQPENSLHQAISQQLGVAARSASRLLVRLRVKAGTETSVRICQTENISESEMLVRTSQLFPVGTEMEVEISVGAREGPIVARARVVRHTVPSVERVTGMGLRFVDIASEMKERLREFVWSDLESG